MASIKETDFYRVAMKLHKILEAADDFDGADELEALDTETGIVAELKDLMATMTDEDREAVTAAFSVIKKYAEAEDTQSGDAEPEPVPEDGALKDDDLDDAEPEPVPEAK